MPWPSAFSVAMVISMPPGDLESIRDYVGLILFQELWPRYPYILQLVDRSWDGCSILAQCIA